MTKKEKAVIGGVAGFVVVCAALAALLLLPERFMPEAIDGRWYNAQQVLQGAEVYNKHCISCHGINARGAADWKTRLANGAYPPPPLNGSAHTWHHPLAQLRRTIKDGNIRLGGQMPPFGDKLTAKERDAVIAYIQSLWPDRVYQDWHEKVNHRR